MLNNLVCLIIHGWNFRSLITVLHKYRNHCVVDGKRTLSNAFLFFKWQIIFSPFFFQHPLKSGSKVSFVTDCSILQTLIFFFPPSLHFCAREAVKATWFFVLFPKAQLQRSSVNALLLQRGQNVASMKVLHKQLWLLVVSWQWSGLESRGYSTV